MQVTIAHYTNLIEKLLDEVIIKSLPGYWKEDRITENFLIALNEHKNLQITDLRGLSKVKINSFKQAGPTETMHGDIAVIMHIFYPDGSNIEGVGFLEAKKRQRNGNNFDAIKIAQLRRIDKNSPRAKLLLYDYDYIPQFIESQEYNLRYYREESTLKQACVTKAVSIPINIHNTTKKFNTSLYKYGIPLSHQLTYKYFYAQDLEFDTSIINRAKGFAAKNELSSYVIHITISPANKPDPDIPGLIVNNNVYQIITQ